MNFSLYYSWCLVQVGSSSHPITSPLFTCPHPLFIFFLSPATSLPWFLCPPAHSSCFRTRQRLPPDYAWVGLNDYIKPRTKSRTSRWDLMCRRGEGSGGGGDASGRGSGGKMTTVSQWEHDNPSARPAEMKSRGSTR